MKLTAIIPCYNEESALRYFYEEMERVMRSMPQVDFELLFVNDGSKDNTLEQIKALSACEIYLVFQEFREGSCHLCRT